MDGEGRLFFFLFNPLPGLAPELSDYAVRAGFCGVANNDLIRGILESALERYGMPAPIQ
jgi:D-alanine-D-alanine ligase